MCSDVDLGQVPLDSPRRGALVATLPPLVGGDATSLEDGDYVYDVDVAGRTLKLPFFARRATRDALAHADRALAPFAVASAAPAPWLRDGTLDSVRNLRDRLAHLVDHGDADADAQKLEAHGSSTMPRERARARRRSLRASEPARFRRAYRSIADGSLQEFGLYVPPGYDPAAKKRWPPVIVALHGLANGRPMAMLRWFFGGDCCEEKTKTGRIATGPSRPIRREESPASLPRTPLLRSRARRWSTL